jgi:hypothetical protein
MKAILNEIKKFAEPPVYQYRWSVKDSMPLIAIRNIYMAAPVHVAVTHGLIPGFVCGPNSTCKFLILKFRHLQVRVLESRRGHHHGETWPRSSPSSTRAPRDKHVSAENRTAPQASTLAMSYSQSLLNFYSEPLQYVSGLFAGLYDRLEIKPDKLSCK